MEKFDDDLLEQIFDFMVRDFSKYALEVYYKRDSSEKQQEMCLKMLRKPFVDYDRFDRFWKNHVYALRDTYEMNE